MKNIISKEMIEPLIDILINGSKKDKNIALGILNNRDLKNKESENNVNVITDAYLKKNHPAVFTLKQEAKLLNHITSVQSSLNIVKSYLEINERQKERDNPPF